MLDNRQFPWILESMALEFSNGTIPDRPARLISISKGESVYALKLVLRDPLTLAHSGYLTEQILEAKKAAAAAGAPVEFFFIDEKRQHFRLFQEPALNPSNGRILFCVIGPGNAPEAALRRIALAERRWPREMKLLDSDGFPKTIEQSPMPSERKEEVTKQVGAESAPTI